MTPLVIEADATVTPDPASLPREEPAAATAVDAPNRDASDDTGAPTGGPGRRWRGAARRLAAKVVPPLLVFAVVIGLWQYVSTKVLEPSKSFLLPAPGAVLQNGILVPSVRAELLDALKTTTVVALTGLAAAIILGVLIAVVMGQARWIERSLYPYAVVLQTIPILAVVPLIGFWFGFEFRSRVFVCMVIAIFPIITNTLFGLQSVSPGHHDLFTLHRAGRLRRLWRLELPTALPAMITGFRISAGLAVIGAIIADFFFRQGDPGIGRLIDMYRQKLATEELLTAVFLSSLLGLVVFWALGWVAALVTRGRQARPPS